MEKRSSKMFQCKNILWEIIEDMAKDYGMTKDYLINVALTELAHSKGYLELPVNKNRKKVKKLKDHLLEDNLEDKTIPLDDFSKKKGKNNDLDFPNLNDNDDLDFPNLDDNDDLDFPNLDDKNDLDFPDLDDKDDLDLPSFNSSDDLDFPDLDDDFPNHETEILGKKTPPTPKPPTPKPPTPKPPTPIAENKPIPPKPVPPKPRLFVECAGNIVPVNKAKFVIGRGSKADLRITDNPSISRKHAIVVRKGGKYYIKDLGSINGTEFKGKKYDIKQIANGDVFTICDIPIKFRFKKS